MIHPKRPQITEPQQRITAEVQLLPGPPSEFHCTHFRKKRSFGKIGETTVFIRSGAFQGNRQSLRNHVFDLPKTPGALRGLDRSPQVPPAASQSPLWSLQGRPESSQERPGASKGHIKFTKLACSTLRKYVYLTSRDLRKTLSDHLSTLPVPPRDPPEW